ncbi:MAG: redoxin domain-containing protein [Deferribacterales bacterium]
MRKFILTLFLVLLCAYSYAGSMDTIDNAGLQKVIKSFKGKTMVVFWAPWCPHCMRELRMLRENPDFLKNNNIQVVGITKEKDCSFAISTVKDEKFPFKFFIGTPDLYKELMKIDAVPYTRVYGHDGNLIDDEYGSQKLEDLKLMLD